MIYILLGAGSGTRMGALTSDRAKILVEVENRPILAHNLTNIGTAYPKARIRIVTGYGAAAVAAFVMDGRSRIGAETIFNSDHARSGPLRSLEVGLAAIDADETIVTIGNGDTIFAPDALTALGSSTADLSLLASIAGAEGDLDDVQLQVGENGVEAAAKHIGDVGSLPVSAGLLQIRGHVALERVRAAVRAGVEQEQREGRMLTWHSILARLARFGPRAVMVPRDSWWEFDSQESIDRYRTWVEAQKPEPG